MAETTPVGAGDTLFARPIERRILHSVRSASVEYKIPPKRLRKILLAKRIITVASDVTDERAVFAADDATLDLLRKASNSVSLTQAETYLGAGRVHAKLLVESGFIEPFVNLPAKTFGEMNFAKDDLDAFLAELFEGAATVVAVPEGAFDIPAAAKRANCGAAEVITLVVERKLRWTGRRSGVEGYLSLLVDLEEIKGLVHGGRREGFTARELETRLRTNTKVVAALLKNGRLPTSMIVNPVNRCPTRVVSPADVEAFETEFMSLNGVAEEWGQHFRQVKSELTALGIAPALTRNSTRRPSTAEPTCRSGERQKAAPNFAAG